MATPTKRAKRQQGPKPRLHRSRRPPLWVYLAAGAGIVALGVAVVTLTTKGSSPPSGSEGLPNTPDYHSLLVDPKNADDIFLGTHIGIYRSRDAGRHWAFFRLQNRDAMNLARAGGGQTVWLAGHNVFARSDDGGTKWRELSPPSLPSLDIHGFAVDPRAPRTLYAAVAGHALYRSTDGGVTFRVASPDVGGAVFALAVTPGGAILAGDAQRGLLRSEDGGGTWREALNARLAGLALSPRDPDLILAAGPGVLRSTDGGRTWKQVLEVGEGAGPVAWSRSDPSRAYVVGFDRTLYRSDDDGARWAPVG
jgi:photosystem II stability/assembly factor-like uncharacterized protein